MDISELKNFEFKPFKDVNEAIRTFNRIRSGGRLNPPSFSPEDPPPAGTFSEQVDQIKVKIDLVVKRISAKRSSQTSNTVKNIMPSNMWVFENNQTPNDHTVFVQNNTKDGDNDEIDFNTYFMIQPFQTGTQPRIIAPWGLDSAFKRGGARYGLFENLCNALYNGSFTNIWASAVKITNQIFPMTPWEKPTVDAQSELSNMRGVSR